MRHIVLAAFLAAHAGLLAWVGWKNAPVSDETAHLAAGISVWRFGRFDLYRVNPPLVRVVAATPVVLYRPQMEWSRYEKERSDVAQRPEFSVGIDFVRQNKAQAQWYFALARWACIPFSLIGGYICWRWASELYGNAAGMLALILWCFSPNIIAWSATICPDAAAAALGVAACYVFWRWLKGPDWSEALLAGLLLGVVQLTKMTWLILFAIWPIVWLARLWKGRRVAVQMPRRNQVLQMATILVGGLYVLNLGYAFDGSFTKVGDFTFVSRTLAGGDSIVEGGRGGNRFVESWLGEVPVPLPKSYVQGIDVQKADFEKGLPSYLFGQWEDRGWWYYYVICAVLKVPLGIWGLGLLTVGMRLWPFHPVDSFIRRQRNAMRPERRRYRAGQSDEAYVLLFGVVLFAFVSSQSGISRHFRYVLPAFPFFFIWISNIARVAVRKPRTVGIVAAGAVIWTTTSSLAIYPHSMSYFNELAGGPQGGHRYLLDANIDWGQDVLYLKKWCEEHPEARPLHVLFRNSFSEDLLGIANQGLPPPGPTTESHGEIVDEHATDRLGPQPGWYACSVDRIHAPHGKYRYFLQFTPVATAGYSIYIYHITLEEAIRVRKLLGMPPVPVPHNSSSHGLSNSLTYDESRLVDSLASLALMRKSELREIRVAVFEVGRQSRNATSELIETLSSEPDWIWEYVSPAQVQSGMLGRFDVVVFPGGSGSQQAAALGDEGRRAVRKYVDSGGGYVGICGGAFLATAGYDWSLALVNAKTLTGEKHIPGLGSRSMAARGSGTVKIELTSAGKRILGDLSGSVDVQYSSGPILFKARRADIPEFVTLGRFRTEVWEYEPQRGTMIDTPAIIAGRFGKGYVMVISPHPEMTEGLEVLVKRAILSTAQNVDDADAAVPKMSR